MLVDTTLHRGQRLQPTIRSDLYRICHTPAIQCRARARLSHDSRAGLANIMHGTKSFISTSE
jgi:hypothetical protein